MTFNRYASLLFALCALAVLSSPASAFTATPTGFGFQNFDFSITQAPPPGSPPEALGPPATQAGSHPYALTVTFELNNALTDKTLFPVGGDLKNLDVNAPPGLVGNPNAATQCTRQELDIAACPASSQIGVDTAGLGAGGESQTVLTDIPVYNMVPPAGAPAEFAFDLQHVHVFLEASVRSGSDYGITVHANNITQSEIVIYNTITFWGVPGDPSHDAQRCTSINGSETCGLQSDAPTTPFLTLPTSCEGLQTFSAQANTWEEPNQLAQASFLASGPGGTPIGFTGCDRLHFNPSISAALDTSEADTPAGLTVEVKVPQEGLPEAEGLSTADIKNTTVVLPEGLVINPGQAAGLAACQPSEDALGLLPEGEENNGPPACPAASKVGEVRIKTPLLEGAVEKELTGNVYVLQSNPPNLKLLVAASADGVNLKLVGDVHLNETTGQLTTTFTETPELPFTDFKLTFSGGAQAALATPTACGVYTTTSVFAPWSTPFTANVVPSSAFAITSGPDGAPCLSSPLPFSPSMTAGSTTDQAGGFTDFSLLLQNGDGQQRISKLQFKFPPGFSGVLSTVPLCQEPQAAQGTCSSASQIGHTTIASGPGPYPLVIPQPGDPEAPMYLTGPYKGAPFGLSIVTPVIAGPFNLGTIVTRAKIEVDPHTAQITITTDPLPQVIDGVPTDLRTINAVADRPGFMINPTDCNPQEFSGTATSAQSATAAISSHFQVGSCRSLEFRPKFSVSTSGKTSKEKGADLITKLTYPNAPQGSQANIAIAKFDLPKQLPSRLTTLQKACANAQFEANPAGCPLASMIGYATVVTPLLPVPVTGPAIFVSHGGEAFPSLTMVLQGDGVTVDVVGTTFISKAGITSTTFKTVPDVPFNTFELTLPQGKFSALAANGNLCTSKLAMPTAFVAQNGAEIHESTPIGVTGCAKTKTLTRAQKLAVALKTCRKKVKGKRAGCERRARKQYASAKAGAKRKHNKQH